MSAAGSALFIAVFLACVVEAVEATTIVLAAGTARDWRSAGTGSVAALAVLAVVVAVLGPAVSHIPLTGLRVVVGALLLVFGLQWVRKAILRASGHKALHDEDKLYAEHLAAAQSQQTRQSSPAPSFLAPDAYGFTLAFKGVLLEGLEVVFIVLTFGANAKNVGLAAIAAGCAIALVVAAGYVIKAPLARVPENTMKFVVGIMLTSFGVFWGGEGAGAHWPGSDAALLVIIPAIALLAVGADGVAAAVGRRRKRRWGRVAGASRPERALGSCCDVKIARVRRVLVRLRDRRRLAGRRGRGARPGRHVRAASGRGDGVVAAAAGARRAAAGQPRAGR